MGDECSCQWFEHSLVLPFLGIGMRINIFQPCGHCWVFQICLHVECSTLTASYFRILNSSAGIPSPTLALLAAVLPKAQLTSHSRMSGSSWVTTPLWLSRSLRSFLYSSSVYSYSLFLISSASSRSLPFLSFSVPIFRWNISLISSFFEDISVVFLYFFAGFIEEHFLVSPCYSLELCIWLGVHFPFSLAFWFSSFLYLFIGAIYKASPDKHFPFLHFFFFGMVLFTVSCTILCNSVHSSSGILFTRSNPLNLFITSTVYS